MRSLYCLGAVVVALGIGYGIARICLKANANRMNNENPGNSQVEPQEVEMSTEITALYAIVKDLPEYALPTDPTTKADFIERLKSVDFHFDSDAVKFHSKEHQIVGFMVKTRFGNVVVWNDLTGPDVFDTSVPEQLANLLPSCVGSNLKVYLGVGKSVEKLLGEG